MRNKAVSLGQLIGKPRLGFLIPAAMAVLIAACSSSSKETANALALALNPPTPRADEPTGIVRSPEEFALKGVADQQVNLDVNGQPLSVVVRVIQLRDKNEFMSMTFDAAASRSDTELFPKELTATSEVVLMPGTTKELKDKLLPETRYVGVIGFFRRPDAQFWRMLFDARAVRNEGLIFVARDCYFSAMTPQAEPMPGQSVGYAPECAGGIPSSRSRR